MSHNATPVDTHTDEGAFLQFLLGAGLHWHQHGLRQLLHQSNRPLHGQQALQELLQGEMCLLS